MKNKNIIDVLIVCRPDHSLQIYDTLVKQNKISFKFLTFKVFPQWLKKLTKSRKMVSLSKNVICSWPLTVVNLLKYKFKFKFAQRLRENNLFDSKLKRIFRNNNVKLIHYWPEYGDKVITNYINSSNDAIAFADIHMPHPCVVYEEMKPIYSKYGIRPESTHLYTLSHEENSLVQDATDILTPSSYVVQTYKQLYNDKQYHVVSYGVIKNKEYIKKYKKQVTEFVYAGRISLEKGSDLLLKYFCNHPEYNIHLFGYIPSEQAHIFNKYKQFSNIFFHGVCPKQDLQKYFSKYDVGVHLSRFDAYSLAVGEMIGCGLPVIVSDHTGIMDDVKNEGFGLVTSLNECDIAKAIELVTELSVYNSFVDNIHDYFEYRYVPYSEKMIHFYRNVLGL